MDRDSHLLFEAYSRSKISSLSENAEGIKLAKIHGQDVWELQPPLKATESRWPNANLTSRGEMKQVPVTVEYLHLQRNQDGSFDAIDAEDPSRSTVINLPLPQGFNPRASFEDVLKALGYTVTEKDGQTQLGLGENEEGTNFVEFIKGIPTKDLLKLYKEDLHVYHSGNREDYSHSVADSNLMFMRNELLQRGISKDKLRALNDEAQNEIGS